MSCVRRSVFQRLLSTEVQLLSNFITAAVTSRVDRTISTPGLSPNRKLVGNGVVELPVKQHYRKRSTGPGEIASECGVTQAQSL